MKNTILEVEGLFRIIKLKKFRATTGVSFDIVPKELIKNISGIDRVVHKTSASSPGSVNGVDCPWYMHEFQEDNLIVLDGVREVDLYSVKHGKVEKFEVSADWITLNGELIIEEPCMLVWSCNVFHRVTSPVGSASINLAVRLDGYNGDTNFSIYDVDTDSGKYAVIREGFLDQF